MSFAVQVVMRGSNEVVAQRLTAGPWITEAEEELSINLLPDYQRLRTVMDSHPSVAEFERKTRWIEAGCPQRPGWERVA